MRKIKEWDVINYEHISHLTYQLRDKGSTAILYIQGKQEGSCPVHTARIEGNRKYVIVARTIIYLDTLRLQP